MFDKIANNSVFFLSNFWSISPIVNSKDSLPLLRVRRLAFRLLISFRNRSRSFIDVGHADFGLMVSNWTLSTVSILAFKIVLLPSK